MTHNLLTPIDSGANLFKQNVQNKYIAEVSSIFEFLKVYSRFVVVEHIVSTKKKIPFISWQTTENAWRRNSWNHIDVYVIEHMKSQFPIHRYTDKFIHTRIIPVHIHKWSTESLEIVHGGVHVTTYLQEKRSCNVLLHLALWGVLVATFLTFLSRSMATICVLTISASLWRTFTYRCQPATGSNENIFDLQIRYKYTCL